MIENTCGGSKKLIFDTLPTFQWQIP
jgi:hypothetical protein